MKLRLILLLCICSEFSYSQIANDNDQFFVFNKKWEPVDIKKAAYFLRVRQLGDSNWEWMYYNIYGPRVKLEHYKDTKRAIKNGNFVYYFPKGTIDSLGNYVNDQPDGEWRFLDAKEQLIRKKTYSNGVLLSDSSFTPKNDPAPSKKYEKKPGEIESEYPGGQSGWARFLNKNLHYPDRAINNTVQGEVSVQFIVDKEGNVTDPAINKSVEYPLDEEALRMMSICGKWTPAVQDGRLVRSYKRQPIIFKLD